MARLLLLHPLGTIHPRGAGLIVARSVVIAPPPDAVTWTLATSDANYQLSLDRLSAKTSGKAAVADILLRANTSAASGYFEVVVNAAGGGMSIGVANSSEAIFDWVGAGTSVGFNANGNAYHSGGALATYTAYTTSTIGVCRKGNFLYFSKDGAWQGGSDPSAGTGGLDVSTFASDTLFPAVSTNNNALDITARFTAASMTYPIPSGVTAWDGTSVVVASSTGTGASTEDTDSTATSGAVAVSGSGASTETADTGGGVGAVSVSASGASAEGTDTTSAAGAVSVSGTGTDTEGTDSSSGAGTAAQPGSVGAGASTEGTDTSAGVALTLVSGTGSAIEAADTCSGSGTVLAISFGHIKLWMGTGFAAKPVKFWSGTGWVTKPLKRWTGTGWQETSY